MRYERQSCLHCKREFAKNDDIVVCPVCGTPHHRQCWQENGGCENGYLHAEGYRYSDNSGKKQSGEIICPKCGKSNPGNALICSDCGADFSSGPEQNGGFNDAGSGEGKHITFDFIPKNKYADSNEEIDGVPVSQIADYVRVKTDYYIPEFLKLCRRKLKISWNWAAFIMPTCVWFYYRKCYLFGTLAAFVNVVMQLLFNGFLEEFSSISEMYYTVGYSEFAAAFWNLMGSSQAIAFFSSLLIMKVIIGMFGNNLYKIKTINDIKSEKRIVGVNILAPVIGYFGFSYLAAFAAYYLF